VAGHAGEQLLAGLFAAGLGAHPGPQGAEESLPPARVDPTGEPLPEARRLPRELLDPLQQEGPRSS
jgi:hypothetical protein